MTSPAVTASQIPYPRISWGLTQDWNEGPLLNWFKNQSQYCSKESTKAHFRLKCNEERSSIVTLSFLVINISWQQGYVYTIPAGFFIHTYSKQFCRRLELPMRATQSGKKIRVCTFYTFQNFLFFKNVFHNSHVNDLSCIIKRQGGGVARGNIIQEDNTTSW